MKQKLANISQRLFSDFIDWQVIVYLNILLIFILKILFAKDFFYSDLFAWIFYIYYFLPITGKTTLVGKRYVNLKIVSLGAKAVNQKRLMLRQLLLCFFWLFLPRIILESDWFVGPGLTMLFYLFLLIFPVVDKKSRHIHDLIAQTEVISTKMFKSRKFSKPHQLSEE